MNIPIPPKGRTPAITPATVADWLALFIRPGDVAELRALHVSRQGYVKAHTEGGFFDGAHLADMADAALRLTDTARGVYFTLNPLRPEILARCANRVKVAETGDLASDPHVANRRRLLVDIDPVRVAGIGATDAEKAAARAVADAVRQHLAGLGWPAPIFADSGIGWHTFYPVDLPAVDGGLVQGCLAALARRFDTDAAKVDKSVHNAARIVKVPGTLARKGDATPDRPHRRGAILEYPATLGPTPRELVEALAAEEASDPAASVPSASPSASAMPAGVHERNGRAAGKHRLDVPRWLTDRGVAFRAKDAKDGRGRTVFALERCLFNADHLDAAVMQADDGKLSAHCFHNSCTGKGWQDFKQAIGAPDPDHFDPPLQRKGDSDKESESHAALLVALATDALELFHDGETAYGTVGRSAKTFALASRAFRQLLAHWFYAARGRVPSTEASRAALDALVGKALFEGPDLPVHVRLAQGDGAIYLDLGREDCAAVRVTASGWDLVTDYPIKFRHPRGMLPVPLPDRGGNLTALRKLVNVESDTDWRLLLAWLLAAFRPTGPYPVLILTGEQGAAKSTTARLLRSLIDPNAAPLRSEPRDGRDLVIAARNSWILAFDNLSSMPNWLSDCLCRLATGGGFGTRQLFTDDEEVIFDSQRPIILTSIEDVADRGDLLDRAVIVRLPAIPEERRLTESAFWAAVDAARPQIMGALFDAVAEGLRNLPHVHLDRLPRMADFAAWVTACEPGLDWPTGSFLNAYRGNVADSNELALDSSPIWPPLRQLVDECGTWEGTASELLEVPVKLVGEKVASASGWPKKPHVLSGRLRRLAPNLRRAGFPIEFGARHAGRKREKTVRVEIAETADEADTSGRSPENAAHTPAARPLTSASNPPAPASRPLSAIEPNHGKNAARPLASASSASSGDCAPAGHCAPRPSPIPVATNGSRREES